MACNSNRFPYCVFFHWKICKFLMTNASFLLNILIKLHNKIQLKVDHILWTNHLKFCLVWKFKILFGLIQETMEETGSESASGDHEKTSKRRRRYNQKRRSVVNPDENFYFYWLMMLTGCILYNLWTLIVRQSFPELQVCYYKHSTN